MKKKIKIFILGSDIFCRKIVYKSLSKNYTDVTYFNCEIDFISALEQSPNIIILDHKFQKNSELNVLKKIKNASKKNSIHIIYLTPPHKRFLTTLNSIRVGALDYIQKDAYTVAGIKISVNRILKLTNDFSTELNINQYRKWALFRSSIPFLKFFY